MPAYFYRNQGKLSLIRKYQIYKNTKISLMKYIKDNRTETKVNLIHLFGQTGSGKSSILRDISDKLGYQYQ